MIRGVTVQRQYKECDVESFEDYYSAVYDHIKICANFKMILEFLSKKHSDVYHMPKVVEPINVSVMITITDDEETWETSYLNEAWQCYISHDEEGQLSKTPVFLKKKEAMKAAYLECLAKCNPHWEKDVPSKWKKIK